MLCSIELWLRFAYYSIWALCRGQWPLTIRDGDVLGRQLFSGHVRPNGKIEVNAFVASVSSAFGISLDRWSKAPEHLFKRLALEAAKASRRNFKGFALFDATRLKSVRIKNEPDIRARGVPTKRNPFHGDIKLPSNRDRSFYLLVATELRDKTMPKALLYK